MFVLLRGLAASMAHLPRAADDVGSGTRIADPLQQG
jgi:hypothetical protein